MLEQKRPFLNKSKSHECRQGKYLTSSIQQLYNFLIINNFLRIKKLESTDANEAESKIIWNNQSLQTKEGKIYEPKLQ